MAKIYMSQVGQITSDRYAAAAKSYENLTIQSLQIPSYKFVPWEVCRSGVKHDQG
jgi:hypothetical protein